MINEFNLMFNDVIAGKSIRDCEKQYGINRNTFITCLLYTSDAADD